MKILIISYYYKHKRAMASVRAVKLAENFKRQGEDVTVYTSNQRDTWTKAYNEPSSDGEIEEIYANEHRLWTLITKGLNLRRSRAAARTDTKANAPVNDGTAKAPSILEKIKARMRWRYYFLLSRLEDYCLLKGLKKEYERQGKNTYDAVIATYPTYGALKFGAWLKKRNKCKQFIADFRDPLYNPAIRTKKAESEYDKRCLGKILAFADRTVCVSEGILDSIKAAYPEYRRPSAVITNGYDETDCESAESVSLDGGKLNFVYTGAMYNGKRSCELLLKSLTELIEEGKLSACQIAFHYAGEDFAIFKAKLEEFGLEKSAFDHGSVSREYSLGMQKSADALLLLSWNDRDYRGVIPGKLYEYMPSGKPIIALIEGEAPSSEVKKIIEECGVGIAAEHAHGEEDISKLKEYLEKMLSGKLILSADTSKYSYEKIAEHYLEFIGKES